MRVQNERNVTGIRLGWSLHPDMPVSFPGEAMGYASPHPIYQPAEVQSRDGFANHPKINVTKIKETNQAVWAIALQTYIAR